MASIGEATSVVSIVSPLCSIDSRQVPSRLSSMHNAPIGVTPKSGDWQAFAYRLLWRIRASCAATNAPLIHTNGETADNVEHGHIHGMARLSLECGIVEFCSISWREEYGGFAAASPYAGDHLSRP